MLDWLFIAALSLAACAFAVDLILDMWEAMSCAAAEAFAAAPGGSEKEFEFILVPSIGAGRGFDLGCPALGDKEDCVLRLNSSKTIFMSAFLAPISSSMCCRSAWEAPGISSVNVSTTVPKGEDTTLRTDSVTLNANETSRAYDSDQLVSFLVSMLAPSFT